MTDDLTLLQLAAKVAGYSIRSDAWARKHSDGGETLYMGDHGPAWNPLTDDGDAMRLAVKLGIDVQQFEISERVEAWIHGFESKEEDYGEDPYAATRRAIVRAAAAIGEAMP
jgi:hypothetical protein